TRQTLVSRLASYQAQKRKK
ncbi:PIN domain protein, partial [Vibrio parahaemolyticus VPTS-2010]